MLVYQRVHPFLTTKKGRTPAGLRLVELRRSKITSSPLFRTPGRAIFHDPSRGAVHLDMI